MKTNFLKIFFVLCAINLTYSQEWMTNLSIAQKLALVQNKMVLMVWEETTNYPYPVLVKDDSGRTIFIQNLYEDETISPLIWEHFVPVIVSENQYADMYEEIKGKRKQNYIDKFNDDSIKIMDVNGNILNASDFSEDYQNISKIIQKYALNTAFINAELRGYQKEKNFYSTYYLASKYLDFALFANKKTRPTLIDLSNIYLNEAIALVETKSVKEKSILLQRSQLLKIQEYLILRRPKKVIRQLNKIDVFTIEKSNEPFLAFLYYAAYMSLDERENAEEWKSKISSVNLKKAQLIINLNT